MADDLSAPLGRKKAKARPALGLSFSAEKLPLARAAFGLVAFGVFAVVSFVGSKGRERLLVERSAHDIERRDVRGK